MTIKHSDSKPYLCERHRNMALKLRPLQSIKVITTAIPDAFIRTDDDETLENIHQKTASQDITFMEKS